MLLIGEGTADIQRMIIGRRLLRTTSCADPRGTLPSTCRSASVQPGDVTDGVPR